MVVPTRRDERASEPPRDPADEPLRVDSQRLAVVARATENVTHEINNALMSLANYAEIAGMPQVTAEQRASYLGRVSRLVDEIADLVRVVRAVAVDGSSEPGTVDLNRLVDRAIVAARTGLRHANVAFDADLPPGSCPVIVREAEFLQSLVGHLLCAGESVSGVPRIGGPMPRVSLVVELHPRAHARVVIRATGGLVDGVAPSLRAFDLPRALAVRAGAQSSVGVEEAAGALVAQLTVPRVASADAPR